jgi:putative ABC transport system substrate-binding protein
VIQTIRILLLACLLCLAFIGEGGAQSRVAVAVLFPDVGEPYRSIFTKIIEGIEDKANGKVTSIALSASVSPQELASQLKRQDIKTVIALGRDGIKASANLDHDFKVLVGGVVTLPAGDAQQWFVGSLAPDPTQLFARLRGLLPQIKKIHVIYDPGQSGWLIKLAQQAAKSNGMELVAQEAQDIKSAMLLYQNVLAKADPKTEALWLAQDKTTVQDSVVLPVVLRSAWSNNLAVFSSNVNHVSQGVLFAMYPNNVEYGKKLGQMAQQANPAHGLHPLRELLLGVNRSTASHLGVNFSFAQLQEFDMVFPER